MPVGLDINLKQSPGPWRDLGFTQVLRIMYLVFPKKAWIVSKARLLIAYSTFLQ